MWSIFYLLRILGTCISYHSYFHHVFCTVYLDHCYRVDDHGLDTINSIIMILFFYHTQHPLQVGLTRSYF